MEMNRRKILAGAALLAAFAIIPYCSQSRIDRAALDKADASAAEARAAAERAGNSAAEAAAAAKAAEHAADDVRPSEGPGS
jgi:hypothetical protein